MRAACYFCHHKTLQKLLLKFAPEENRAEELIFAVHELLGSKRNTANPMLARELHRIARENLLCTDLYREEKIAANTALLAKEDTWRKKINSSDHPFKLAARMAVIGNIIDYGAHSLKGDLEDQIETLARQELALDDTEKLEQALTRAGSVLYLGDNAGEIVFDKLFIEQIKHPNLTFAVRGAPVINDVTLEDASQTGLTSLCHVISNGYDAPSTLLPHCSKEFITAYENADLIISKGQGNFEGLFENTRADTFFLLIAKCLPIAEMLGVAKGDMVIARGDFQVSST